MTFEAMRPLFPDPDDPTDFTQNTVNTGRKRYEDGIKMQKSPLTRQRGLKLKEFGLVAMTRGLIKQNPPRQSGKEF